MILPELQKQLAATTQRCSQEAVDEGRVVTDEIDGVKVELRYEHSQGRGTIKTWSGVFLDGERYGTEYEVIPWNIFKDPATWYEVGGLMSEEQAQRILAASGAEDVTVEEEYYPPDPPELPRHFFSAKSLESVVKLWKAEQWDIAKKRK